MIGSIGKDAVSWTSLRFRSPLLRPLRWRVNTWLPFYRLSNPSWGSGIVCFWLDDVQVELNHRPHVLKENDSMVIFAVVPLIQVLVLHYHSSFRWVFECFCYIVYIQTQFILTLHLQFPFFHSFLDLVN